MDRILTGMWQAIKEQMVEDFSIFGLFALVILVLCIILVLLLRRRTTPQVGLSKIRSADTLLPLDLEPHIRSEASTEPKREEAKPLPQAASNRSTSKASAFSGRFPSFLPASFAARARPAPA